MYIMLLIRAKADERFDVLIFHLSSSCSSTTCKDANNSTDAQHFTMATSQIVAETNKSKLALEQARRNRINQRNYRARQQQRIKELQAEQQERRNASIVASQEVQRAAHVVIAENAILRDILVNDFGCDEVNLTNEIRRRLSGDKVSSMGFSSLQKPVVVRTLKRTCSNLEGNIGKRLKGSSTIHKPQSRNSQSIQDTTEIDASPAELIRVAEPPAQESVMLGPEPVNDLSNRQFYGNPRMSCEKAAAILSSIAHRTTDEIREELGCPSGTSCHIDNVIVMQAMDKSV